MTGTDLGILLESAPALQMLRMRNAHWILPFLYGVFKENNLFSMAEPQLVHLLADTLNGQAEGMEDLEEARIEAGENEEGRARRYLLNWVQRRLLQDFQDAEGTSWYQLSAHTEKVFQWLQSLEKKQFVGTESRFKLLFSTLQDMVEKTQDDRIKRLEELKNKRAEIDKEIKALELGAAVEVYSRAQVQERLELFTRLCYDLLGDFREVEDNFKQIHRNIVEQHTRSELHKGAIIGYAFEAYDALRNSDQGKSFYAFWDFLISRPGQEKWRLLTGELLQLLEDRELEGDHFFIQNIKSFLLQQGRNVYEANDRMAEKLSRIISEKGLARHKRLRQQISSIKELVFSLMEEPEVPCGMVMEKPVEIKMSMDRKLVLEPKTERPVLHQPQLVAQNIADIERFGRLLAYPHVDRKKLWKKVEQALSYKKTATLKEIIEWGGLEQGLAEVVAYFGFLRDKSSCVQMVENISEHIALNPEQTRFIEVPYLLFSRDGTGTAQEN